MPQLGEMIRETRKGKGLSLGQVALRSGLDRTYISRIESGKIANPSHKTLMKVAKGLGIAASEFFVKEKHQPAKGHPVAEEAVVPYGVEYLSTPEKEYVKKLLEIFRGVNGRAIAGIKINIELFHQSRNMKQTIVEGDIKHLIGAHL